MYFVSYVSPQKKAQECKPGDLAAIICNASFFLGIYF
jgi:hypothetical protein